MKKSLFCLLLLALVACDDDVGGVGIGGDAALPDAAPDAADLDASPDAAPDMAEPDLAVDGAESDAPQPDMPELPPDAALQPPDPCEPLPPVPDEDRKSVV